MPCPPAVLCLIVLLTGCAALPPPPRDPAAAACLDLYEAVDAAVERAGVRPSYPRRVPGFPYLRVDRHLAAYRDRPLAGPELAAWWQAMAALDQEARALELAALSLAELERLDALDPAPLPAALGDCATRLGTTDLADPRRLAALGRAARVPSDYRPLNRVLGLYPLSALPVSLGIARYQRETLAIFAGPAPPLRGRLLRYRPPPGPAAAPPPAADGLGRPRPEPLPLAALFAAHAPVFEIDTAGDFDRPGMPVWVKDRPTVDPAVPAVYRYVSYTRWQGRPLLQLNYLIWFAGRPLEGPLDILGGALDGLLWRVTLGPDGAPLLYDSIHPCGCYHMFFPGPGLRLRAAAGALPEPPLLPRPAPRPGPGQRLVLRLASGSHYLQQVYADRAAGTPWLWRDYGELYATPVAGGGRRSLFGPDGLVPGSERLERWLLWPMGIPSPGAMRERGHHAVAFVGRRQFEDPGLLESLFEPAPRPSGTAQARQ